MPRTLPLAWPWTLIEDRAASGASLADIEHELDGVLARDSDRRSALWLYAWHCVGAAPRVAAPSVAA